jgi:hypothetical protein
MDSGILMIQDSILVCSPDPRIPHTAHHRIIPPSSIARVIVSLCPYRSLSTSLLCHDYRLAILFLVGCSMLASVVSIRSSGDGNPSGVVKSVFVPATMGGPDSSSVERGLRGGCGHGGGHGRGRGGGGRGGGQGESTKRNRKKESTTGQKATNHNERTKNKRNNEKSIAEET